MSFEKITEQDSLHNNLETWSVVDLLTGINQEDQKVALAVEKVIPTIAAFIEKTVPKMKEGGRLFYIGAGTSGRLGVVDASECPPTFGVDQGVVVGIIAGGDQAIRKAVEFAEDDVLQGWKDLQSYQITSKDTVVGIAASGTTPYVLGALQQCKEYAIQTGCITCNPGSPIALISDFAMVAMVGPEFVTGSTRMKAGTAQKLILNMISTSLMIQLGKIEGNKMTKLQLTNDKLWDRGARIIAEKLNISYQEALTRLKKEGSLEKVLQKSSN